MINCVWALSIWGQWQQYHCADGDYDDDDDDDHNADDNVDENDDGDDNDDNDDDDDDDDDNGDDDDNDNDDNLQWTEMGPSWPNCSLVLCTWNDMYI